MRFLVVSLPLRLHPRTGTGYSDMVAFRMGPQRLTILSIDMKFIEENHHFRKLSERAGYLFEVT